MERIIPDIGPSPHGAQPWDGPSPLRQAPWLPILGPAALLLSPRWHHRPSAIGSAPLQDPSHLPAGPQSLRLLLWVHSVGTCLGHDPQDDAKLVKRASSARPEPPSICTRVSRELPPLTELVCFSIIFLKPAVGAARTDSPGATSPRLVSGTVYAPAPRGSPRQTPCLPWLAAEPCPRACHLHPGQATPRAPNAPRAAPESACLPSGPGLRGPLSPQGLRLAAPLFP